MLLYSPLRSVAYLVLTVAATSSLCLGATTSAHNAMELKQALENAAPGDTIKLSPDTIYVGNFILRVSGTSEQPITILGLESSILDGGSSGETLLLRNASHVRLEGFTVEHGRAGVVLEHAKEDILYQLSVRHTGEQAIQLRGNSTGNRVENSTVTFTGEWSARNGRGIEIGSSNYDWCLYSACEPDRSDHNAIETNHIGPGVTAQCVTVREGTTFTQINSNTLDGKDISGEGDASQWIDVSGNKTVVEYNTAILSQPNFQLTDGIVVRGIYPGFGESNTIKSNKLDLTGYAGNGFGIRISNAKAVQLCESNNVSGAPAANIHTVACYEQDQQPKP